MQINSEQMQVLAQMNVVLYQAANTGLLQVMANTQENEPLIHAFYASVGIACRDAVLAGAEVELEV